jgi:hypothetical protein
MPIFSNDKNFYFILRQVYADVYICKTMFDVDVDKKNVKN